MGRQHIVDGRIKVVQDKTGKVLWIAVAPQLLEAIVAMPAAKNHLCFLINKQGRPFTRAGFGNWFRDKCDAAGLPECTAHGLRKAIMRCMAESNQGNQTMKAVSGHRKDEEVARCTEAANQRSMADGAIGVLVRWERSNRAERLDTDTAENG
jgi:integrase